MITNKASQSTYYFIGQKTLQGNVKKSYLLHQSIFNLKLLST